MCIGWRNWICWIQLMEGKGGSHEGSGDPHEGSGVPDKGRMSAKERFIRAQDTSGISAEATGGES